MARVTIFAALGCGDAGPTGCRTPAVSTGSWSQAKSGPDAMPGTDRQHVVNLVLGARLHVVNLELKTQSESQTHLESKSKAQLGSKTKALGALGACVADSRSGREAPGLTSRSFLLPRP